LTDAILLYLTSIFISNEPKTIDVLFEDLECELHTLSFAMQVFINILD